jgi:hypothetical protein
MKPAKDLQDAENKALPGEWVMCQPVRNTSPEWCVMTEAERMRPCFAHWVSWVRKPVE